MQLPKLYAIVDRATLDTRGLAVKSFAEDMREGGVRLVQYRDKKNGPQEILRVLTEIESVFEGVNATLILNDRADLAALAGWCLHVGDKDLSPADARLVLCADRVLGISTHTEEQIRAADAGESDYIAIGPVFATSTKSDAEAVVGVKGVRRARELTSKPLVAIGGIGLENARSVVDAGADSVAVISGLIVQGRRVRDVARDFLEILG